MHIHTQGIQMQTRSGRTFDAIPSFFILLHASDTSKSIFSWKMSYSKSSHLSSRSCKGGKIRALSSTRESKATWLCTMRPYDTWSPGNMEHVQNQIRFGNSQCGILLKWHGVTSNTSGLRQPVTPHLGKQHLMGTESWHVILCTTFAWIEVNS